MSDIAQWLTGLGLDKYGAAFAEAEIDLLTLPHLTEDDLKDLGLPLGPRRKLLAAIGELGTRTAAPVIESADDPPAALSANLAERRHLTVMFVDLVGSTELTGRLDPEDMREVITGYQNSVAGVVTRFEGFVAKFMGDGILCYFGWPRANEDDAERAVRAGLEIIATVKTATTPNGEALSCRIGIASGLVVVGDLIGEGATQEAAVVGETPNLAARLQGLARPDQLVLPQETRSLLGQIFELEPLGAHDLKGITGPVTAYGVVGEAGGESRFEARRTGTLTPIVGREQELSLMRERWRTAASGTGQMIVVSGDAGIGKSRITRAMIDEIAADDPARLSFQCSPYHTDSAFYPIVRRLADTAGFQPEDAAAARLDKLESVPGVGSDNAPVLAALLGIDAAERYGALDLDPRQLRARAMQALIDLIVWQAKDKPLLVVFEDLHWIDPTSLELLDITLDAIADKKVLLLATARPSFNHGFGGHPAVTRFSLNRLGRGQIEQIVSKLTGGKTLPDEVLQVIASRTDGVPLYVEELTKAVLETGMLRADGDALVLDGPLEALAIPKSLHDSLMARLDRLQPIKEVAQTAACIGREFGHRLLAAISPLPEAELATALEQLIEAELVFRRGVPPDATYLFKHALVRDAAYETLLKARRQEMHRRIAAVLEQHFPDLVDSEPELLAHHLTVAGIAGQAAEYWHRAGLRSAARSANAEAVTQLERGIEMLGQLPETLDRARLELSMWIDDIGPMIALFGYASNNIKEAFSRALALADQTGEIRGIFPILYSRTIYFMITGQVAQAGKYAEELLQLALRENLPEQTILGHRLTGTLQLLLGKFEAAAPHLDAAAHYAAPDEDRCPPFTYGQDIEAAAKVHRAWLFFLNGHPDRAIAIADQAIARARQLDHPNTLGYVLCQTGMMFIWLRLGDRARESLTELRALLDKSGLPVWQAYFDGNHVGFLSLSGDDRGALDSSAATIHAYISVFGMTFLLPVIQGWTADAHIAVGDGAGAIGAINSALDLIEETGERFSAPEILRLNAKALRLTGSNDEEVTAALIHALDTARAMGAKWYELRIATDLARLYRDTGEVQQAVALLAPIHDVITEGFDMPDMMDAKALLAELS